MTEPDPKLEAAVRSAWVKAYGQTSWEENRAFDDEGGDSLEILAIILDIEDALGLEIPANIITVEMAARDLIAAIAKLTTDAAPKTPDDRPMVFLFADGMSGEQQTSLREGLADWFCFVPIDARPGAAQAAEQMLRSDPHGAINVIACGDAAAPATGATEKLIERGYRRGFQFVLDPSADAELMRTRIVDAFIVSRREAT